MLIENTSLIFFSFTASVFFGIVFGIRPKALLHAGAGGVLTRIVLLITLLFSDSRLVYTMVAAMAGAFYSEIIAHRHHTPLAKYLYPALVPIIPGDLLYNTVVCFVKMDADFFQYGSQLLLALMGLALGSMVAPMIAHCPEYLKRVAAQKLSGKGENM